MLNDLEDYRTTRINPLAHRAASNPVKFLLKLGVLQNSTDVFFLNNCFYAAEALIAENGGPLSHGAVTAREMGLPAVSPCAELWASSPMGRWADRGRDAWNSEASKRLINRGRRFLRWKRAV
jgi:hypothetical protein